MSNFPSPLDLGLPEKFGVWRPGQAAAIERMADAATRFTAGVLPTGFGKSVVYMTLARLLSQKQTYILTSTRALQRQLERDFAELGITVIQGMRSYVCKALQPGGEHYDAYGDKSGRTTYVDHGPCHVGVPCLKKKFGGCEYFDLIAQAAHVPIVVTNYAWWFATRRMRLQLDPDLLVLDEAHAAPDALSDALGAELHAEDVAAVLSERLPRAADRTPEEWHAWSQEKTTHLLNILEGVQPKTREAVRKVRQARALLYQVDSLALIPPSLLVLTDTLDGVKADLLWAANFAEMMLFRRAPRVVLTSATMTPHTAALLGLDAKDVTFIEAGEGFPVKRRPVYIAPARKGHWGEALAVDHKLAGADEDSYIAHIDTILDTHAHVKGIIHCVSYRRRDLLVAKSRHLNRFITHGRHDTAARIGDFKAAKPGAVLVSPSVTTGYDFPYQECEYQIICKIPFPDSRDAIVKARTAVDKRYPMHLAMQELVQMVGRGMRAEDDACETFIVDANAKWFLSKHADLAPRWFRKAVKWLDPGRVPSAPPPLAPRTSQGDRSETEE